MSGSDEALQASEGAITVSCNPDQHLQQSDATLSKPDSVSLLGFSLFGAMIQDEFHSALCDLGDRKPFRV